MKKNRTIAFLVSLCLAASVIAAPIAPPAAPRPAYLRTDSDLAKRLEIIESKVEKRRKELGIPGMSLAIVKDGKVVYSKGLGYKDFEKKVPVTSSTQFAIGSATKAFTGLSVLLLQDRGKLSLDDSPKKYLPYFKINDPEIDSKIQVRDLLSHSSGLNRTDLAMITGKLSREELIKVAGVAKPTAGLRETFQYQNIMFAAAGEIVAKISGKAWEKFVPEEILKPLQMNNSSMSVEEMKEAPDYSFGYDYNFDTKVTRRLPIREIKAVSPAGSINSSSDDMAKWLEFIISKGEAGGKRLVSEEGFEEWIKPQMKISPDGKVAYGLGWFVQEWKEKKMIQHGGNIDGFNSMVAVIPGEKVGFAMLTNVTASPLGGELIQTVFSGLLDELPKEGAALTDEEKKALGTYKFPQAGFDVVIAEEEGRLVMKVPNQPTYILEKVEGEKYKLSNAPDGFFITFRQGEAFLEQPQGSFTLKKEGSAAAPATDDVRELIGKYESDQQKGSFIEVKEVEGKTSLVVSSQPPYPLVRTGEDTFRSPNLPETYGLKAKRGADKKVAGIVLVQPEGQFPFSRVDEGAKAASELPDSSEVYSKMLQALGGEANWRKLNSRVTEIELNWVHQGVTAKGTSYQKAPNLSTSSLELFALGKKIGWIRDYFDGTGGGEFYSFGPDETYTGQRLEDVLFNHDFYGYLDVEKKVKKMEVEKIEKVGETDTYRLRIEPLKASPYVLWISKETYLPVRRQSVVVSSTSQQRTPITETYSDYRNVDGVMIPFKLVSTNPNMGDLVTTIKKMIHNVDVSDDKFRKK
ncbi:MAG: serine hydrolase [Acidobacteriota bacterium]|nr:MAG: serine hydrolase [Acidobacteriota bacterium]